MLSAADSLAEKRQATWRKVCGTGRFTDKGEKNYITHVPPKFFSFLKQNSELAFSNADARAGILVKWSLRHHSTTWPNRHPQPAMSSRNNNMS